MMAVIDDQRTFGRTRLSFADVADIDEFVATLDRFERGEINAEEWRRFRLVRGTYGQRQAEAGQMLRVKIPQGLLNGVQLHALADVAEQYSRGFGHITTRQNFQFHFMPLDKVEAAMRRLADAGLTTREACGNSVRNIVACPYAGVASDELFDVTPYAEALTRFLLRHPLSSSLPRKFKIAFEGCASGDHAQTSINDLGWRAAFAPDGSGQRGFRVTVAGGTAIMCRSGEVLFEFLPASAMFSVAEAVVRVFHAHGDYEHRQRNRLKFLLKKMGWDGFRGAIHDALEGIRTEGAPSLPFDPDDPLSEVEPHWSRPALPSIDAVAALAVSSTLRGPGIHPLTVPQDERDLPAWMESNVRAQRQDGYAVATITLPLGDITGGQLRVLAAVTDSCADGLVRITPEQNVMIRWVRAADVTGLYRRLAAAGLGRPGAGSIDDVTSCPGAESCRLAVTQSRGVAALVKEHLAAARDIAAIAPDLKIKVSGCPNGCGLHHIAGIGLQGSVRKLGERVVPQYFVMLGGGAGPHGTTFARLTSKIPARRVPAAIERLLRMYERERGEGESASTFFSRVDRARAAAALVDLESLAPGEARDEDFIDPGENETFVPDVQDGECSA
jgi:sulfite reductase beta subunit-like hemoprotein